MGIGDEIMATGMARGAAKRGKRIAFGDGRRIIWGPWCDEAFRFNPNIARTVDKHVDWIAYYKGHRTYNRAGDRRWLWNYEFKATPGEFYFDGDEERFSVRRDGVLIEPNVPWHKSVAPNKDWGISRYQLVADYLRYSAGLRVFQFSHGRLRLAGVEVIPVSTFRQAAAALAGVTLAIVPEGGLHHAAAAVGTRAVVIFGGFVPPQVTGYDSHVNLTGLAEYSEACGSWQTCQHCRAALNRITVEEVYGHATKLHEHREGTAACGRAASVPAIRAS
jgi:glycosyl transferase family 9 (putative heptosyltransferase)